MLGDMVAHLKVDNKQWSSGLKASGSSVKTFATGAKASLAGVAAAFGPLLAAAGAYLGVSKSLGAFKTQIEAEKKLAAVLEATGGAAGLSAEEIKGYASELQGMTNFGDEATIGVASLLATFKQIKGDTFKEALALGQDMSVVMGQDMKASAMQLGKALNDPIRGLSALADVGVGFTEQQKAQVKAMQEAGDIAGAQRVILDELQGQFGGAASALADPWTQFLNVAGDVSEMLGSVLSPSIAVVSGFLTSMGGEITANADYWRSLGIEVAMFTADVVAAISQIGPLMEIAAKMWLLHVTEMVLDVKHAFTDEIPAYLSWFAENWQDIMFTAGDYAATVFINLGENLKTLWQGVLDFFARKPVKLEWKDLTEGAFNAIKELPDIPERVTTEFEKTLQEDIATLSESTGAAMQKTRDDLTKTLAKFTDVTANIPAATEGFDSEPSTLTTAEKKSSGPRFAGAALAGSADAFSTIVQAMGRNNDPQVKAIDKVEKAIINKVGKPLERIASKQTTVIESFGD